MKELNIDAYLVPSDDPHLSGEYFQEGSCDILHMSASSHTSAPRICPFCLHAPEIFERIRWICGNGRRHTGGCFVVDGFSVLE